MTDATWTTTTKVSDAMILLGDTWVRVSSVETVQPSKAYAEPVALITLKSGRSVYVRVTVADVIDAIKKSMSDGPQ